MCRHARATTAHLLTLIDSPPEGPGQRVSVILCPACLERLVAALTKAAERVQDDQRWRHEH